MSAPELGGDGLDAILARFRRARRVIGAVIALGLAGGAVQMVGWGLASTGVIAAPRLPSSAWRDRMRRPPASVAYDLVVATHHRWGPGRELGTRRHRRSAADEVALRRELEAAFDRVAGTDTPWLSDTSVANYEQTVTFDHPFRVAVHERVSWGDPLHGGFVEANASYLWLPWGWTARDEPEVVAATWFDRN